MSSGLRWVLFGLLGLLVAGVVAFLAIETVSENIGISSESPAAGSRVGPGPEVAGAEEALAPTVTTLPGAATTTVQTQPAPAPSQTADDYTGEGEGEGEGGDD